MCLNPLYLRKQTESFVQSQEFSQYDKYIPDQYLARLENLMSCLKFAGFLSRKMAVTGTL